MKVLIVDDNRLDRLMLSTMLSSNNYDAVEAANGAEALELILSEKPDIVVSDIMMPVMDGFTLLREIRKSKASKELPFIFYSASYVNEKDRELAIALGVSRFIIKPVEPGELVKEITQSLLDISSGKLKIPEPTPIKDEDYLERYSSRIFKMLEEKVSQLETEIEERKRIEEKLQKSEAKYRTLIENIQDGVFIITDGKFQFVNEAFAKLAGYDMEEIIGKDFREFIAPEDLAKVFDYYTRRQAGEKVPHEYEFTALHRDRKTRLILNMTVALINYGGRVATMGTLKDITGRKEAEKQQKEKARGELHGFIVSALPVFASGVPSYVRDILIKNFSERFEMNVKPRFKDEMVQKNVNHDPAQLFTAYMNWLSGLFSNFGIENRMIKDGEKEVLEFINCPWKNEARGNPVFCFICRSLAKRSFTWTGLKGNVEQKSSIASGSKICRFEIQVRDEKLKEKLT